MRSTLLAALLFMVPASVAAAPPLRDPVVLNIGLSCQWQQRCMSNQKKAMKRALKHVKQFPPAPWRVEMCNRNAARKGYRVDWIGFDNCIRNTALRASAPKRSTKRRITNPA